MNSVRKHRSPQISHVIPFFQLCTNSQKSQNFNDPTSNVETTGRELRATFLRNHPRPAPERRTKTAVHLSTPSTNTFARKHRAPKGALRQADLAVQLDLVGSVRKHRAPKGALRLREHSLEKADLAGQKAPSAKRYIKTSFPLYRDPESIEGQKAPSAKRCIKTEQKLRPVIALVARQKAPSAKRCIKTTVRSRR